MIKLLYHLILLCPSLIKPSKSSKIKKDCSRLGITTDEFSQFLNGDPREKVASKTN
jgi:hypothetical protein